MMSSYKIFNDDCLNVLAKLPNKSIDLLLTDPPYLFVKGGMKSKRINVGKYEAESEINSKMSDFDESKIYEFLNCVKPKMKVMNSYIFCSKLQLVSYLKWAQENKLKYDLLVWNKMKNSMISTKFFASNIEYIVRIYGNGCGLNKILNEDDKGDSSYYQKIQSCKQIKHSCHEAEKPIELLEKFILLSSNEGDVILDTFMGSGTTGVACINTNRKFIGIELDENYFNIAKERIENYRKEERK